jgi:activator of 2-hydroxyglutaryl-CoA dehydratase
MCDIYKANYPQYNGAIGAALIGMRNAEKEFKKS